MSRRYGRGVKVSDLDRDERERRAEVARRLKAARWLAGGIGKSEVSGEPIPAELTQRDLAKRDPLPANGITASKIGKTERMERRATPMELAAIALALGQSADYFSRRTAVFTPADVDAALELLRAELGRDVRGETRDTQ